MKKNLLIALLATATFVGLASAKPRGLSSVTQTSRNEGNTRVAIGTTCLSTAWTVALPARANRRGAVLQTLATASNGVCLVTSTEYASCSDTTPSVELNTAASYVDYGEAIMYCRARSATVTLKGFEYYDSAD